jgi:hypothetical protein
VFLGLAKPWQMLINVQALPITEFAMFTALNAPIPQFMPISLRMGPFTRSIASNGVVEGISDDCLVAAVASITGKYSGLAPAITAIIATCSTVYFLGGERE